MLLGSLVVIALGLTITMFAKRESMLGFPSVIFWGILSGYAYNESVATWDMYYFLFFGAIGMAIFCAIAAFGLREKRDSYGDLEVDDGSKEPEGKPIDETPEDNLFSMEERRPVSPRTRKIRERADKRRTGDY